MRACQNIKLKRQRVDRLIDGFKCRTTDQKEMLIRYGKARYTVQVPDPGKPCVFPFSYNGIEYNSCTHDRFQYFWCGVQYNVTDHSGWGICSSPDSCPIRPPGLSSLYN